MIMWGFIWTALIYNALLNAPATENRARTSGYSVSPLAMLALEVLLYTTAQHIKQYTDITSHAY